MRLANSKSVSIGLLATAWLAEQYRQERAHCLNGLPQQQECQSYHKDAHRFLPTIIPSNDLLTTHIEPFLLGTTNVVAHRREASSMVIPTKSLPL